MQRILLLLIFSTSTGLTLGWAQQGLPNDPAPCILPEDALPLVKGFGRQTEEFLWPGNIILYEIEPDGFTPAELVEIDSSIAYFNTATNMCLLPRTLEEDYVNIAISDRGISYASAVGYRGGRHLIRLGLNVGRYTHIHEFGHIVGLIHEHQRPDRDDYITVLYSNIRRPYQYAFYKYPPNTIQLYWSEKYDFNSVMHYNAWGFSQNGSPTIQPRDSGVVIPRNDFFSPTDLATLAKMYPQPIDCDSLYRDKLLDGSIEFFEQLGEVCRYGLVEANFVPTQGDPADWEFTWEVPGGEVVSANGPRAVLRLTDPRTQQVTVSIQKGAYSRTYENALFVVQPEPKLEILGNPVTSDRIDYRFTAVNDRVRVWLIDAGGRRIYTESIQITDCATQRSIDCSSCPTGVYTLTVQDGQELRSQRVQLY